jgi:hypothetical protein
MKQNKTIFGPGQLKLFTLSNAWADILLGTVIEYKHRVDRADQKYSLGRKTMQTRYGR